MGVTWRLSDPEELVGVTWKLSDCEELQQIKYNCLQSIGDDVSKSKVGGILNGLVEIIELIRENYSQLFIKNIYTILYFGYYNPLPKHYHRYYYHF